jgi:malonyl-CoA O-methyltransferase
MLDSRLIRRRFERAAASFDDAAFVHAVTRKGLLARLQPLVVEASTVVDLGSATCSTSQALSKRFGRAHVVSVDLAHAMLRRGRKHRAWFSKSSYVQATAAALPFNGQSVDVVFANLLLPWIDDPGQVFAEVARVLRKGGVFAFATLGPDSLLEIRHAWSQVDDNAHVNHFSDMHDLGDGLVNAGLADPVLDVDRLSVSYDSTEKLFADLTAMGGRNALRERNQSLIGKQRFRHMSDELQKSGTGGKITLDLELVFGHCWGAGPRMDATDYRIDATRIPRRKT